MPYVKGTPVERFWKRVTKMSDGCWLFSGADNGKGYVRFWANGAIYAHQFSYQLHHGPIPPGMLVLHRCDVRNCVRPEHLFVGTYQDNYDDMIAKGRQVPTEVRRALGKASAPRGDAHWRRRQGVQS
jgi:hypothetical protein